MYLIVTMHKITSHPLDTIGSLRYRIQQKHFYSNLHGNTMGRIQLVLRLTREELAIVLNWLEQYTNEPPRTATNSISTVYQYYGPGWQAGYLNNVPNATYQWGFAGEPSYAYKFHIAPEIACIFKLAWNDFIEREYDIRPDPKL